MNSKIPSISIITCSLYADDELQSTLSSVNRQEDVNLESIVVTPDNQIKNLTLTENSQVLIQSDRGIYQAMNIGLRMAQSQYCLFLNGGDEFVSSRVLSKLLKKVEGHLWGYGGIRRVNSAGKKFRYHFSPYSQTLHKYGLRHVPHPATILHTETARRLSGFDESYPIAADQKLILQFSQLSRPIVTRSFIVNFSMDGVSSERNFNNVNMDFIQFRNSLFPQNKLDRLFSGKFQKLLESIFQKRKSHFS